MLWAPTFFATAPNTLHAYYYLTALSLKAILVKCSLNFSQREEKQYCHYYNIDFYTTTLLTGLNLEGGTGKTSRKNMSAEEHFLLAVGDGYAPKRMSRNSP